MMSPALVFENKATVGCVARLTLNPGEMSIAVEKKRILTATRLSGHRLRLFTRKGNPSGGIF